MINLAGVTDCDKTIKKELLEAGIKYQNLHFTLNDEVPSELYASFQGWEFKRAWYYWIASTNTTPLLFKYANELNSTHNEDCRVNGHCGCPSPREEFDKPWDIGVNTYHIDTQDGLNAFIKKVAQQTKELKL